jgi:hypothetical protein
MLQKWDAGGSVGCMRSCFHYLESHGLIEQTFH